MDRKRIGAISLLVALGALMASACGGDDGYGSKATQPASNAATTAAAPPTSAAAGTTVKVGTTAKGPTLTDASGLTLYVFDKDTGGKSACSGTCAGTWPALTVTGTAKPDGLPSGLDTIARDDGAKQVTYNGHPLYHYAGDKGPGDTLGDGVGGVWHVATQSVGAAGSATAQAGGSGYNY